MKKLVILSAGNIASETARLVRNKFSDIEIVIADIDKERADKVANEVKGKGVQFDAADPDSIAKVVQGADLVYNAVGPFYRFGLGIIRAAIANKVNYIDVCDEYDVTVTLTEDKALDKAAKDAGIFAIFGMGFSPGITNLVARWAVDRLDSAKNIEICTSIPYWPTLGVTVNDHMLYSMSGKVPQYIDGKVEYRPAWGDEKEYTFKGGHGSQMIGYMGHPEGVTLGHFIDGVENASMRFRWYEEEGNRVWKSFASLGLTNNEENEQLPMPPRQYLARFMNSEIGIKNIDLKESKRGEVNIFQVNVEGKKAGKNAKVTIEYHGTNEHGDPTPHACAAAIEEALKGNITATGLIAPEVAIKNAEEVATRVLKEVRNKVYITESIEEEF